MPIEFKNSEQRNNWLLKANFYDPEREVILSRLLDNPEALTDNQLRKTPLRVISRALGKLSSRRTIDTYLRWLEVQRQSPKSNINEPWLNLITHWTQSLRARGFRLEEIIDEVHDWKKAHGPFYERATFEGFPLHPSSSDLRFAWKQVAQGAAGAATSVTKNSHNVTMSHDNCSEGRTSQYGKLIGRNQIQDRQNMERTNIASEGVSSVNQLCKATTHRGNYTPHPSLPYLRPMDYEVKLDRSELESIPPHTSSLEKHYAYVPANYQCNRCDGRGHFVNDCPTNEDPSYDIPPYGDYKCKFCKKVGVHYFVFCPQNPDPNSIYRRRQGKQRLRRGSSTGRGLKRSPSPSWDASQDCKTPKLSVCSTNLHDSSGDSLNLEVEYDDLMRSGSPPSEQSFRSSFYDPEETRRFCVSKIEVDMDDAREFNCPAGGTEMTDSTDEGFAQYGTMIKDFAYFKQDNVVKSDDLMPRLEQLELFRQEKEQQARQTEMVIERKENDAQRIRAKQRGIVPGIARLTLLESRPAIKNHDDFLGRLFANHSSRIYGATQKRPTALSMWDLHDERKRQEGILEVTDTSLSNLDLSFDDKEITLDEARGNFMIDGKRGCINIDDKNLMPDQDIRHIFGETQRGAQEGMFGAAIQILIDEGKHYWMEAEFNDVSKRIPQVKRARSSTDGSETEEMGGKKRRKGLKKELDIIENLKRKIHSSEEIELATVEKLKSGNVSLEDLEQISGEIERSITPSSSKYRSCSSGVSRSPAREPYINREGAPSPSEAGCFEQVDNEDWCSAALTPLLYQGSEER